MTEIPHLSFPLRFRDGQAVTVEQDSLEHLTERVAVVALTPIGDRVEDPEFGRPDDLFRAGRIDLDELAATFQASEPDAPVVLERIIDPILVGERAATQPLTLSSEVLLSPSLLLSALTQGDQYLTTSPGTDRIRVRVSEES